MKMALHTNFVLRASLLFFLFVQRITFSNAQGQTCTCCIGDDCDADTECSQENDPSTGITADKAPGLGVEFETDFFSLVGNPPCTMPETDILKGNNLKNNDGTPRQGTNWKLTVDTTIESASTLTAEYILNGTSIKIGQNLAGPAAAAVAQDIVDWNPSKSTPPMTVDGIDSCTWTINKDFASSDTIKWQRQVTAPMPLEAIGDFMMAAIPNYINPPINLLPEHRKQTGNFVYVSTGFFQSSPNSAPKNPSADVMGFFSLVLTYAKAAGGPQPRKSPKFFSWIMPRTDFVTMFKVIKGGLGNSLDSGPDALYQIVRVLACYTWFDDGDGNLELEIDSNLCTGTLAAPVPNGNIDKFEFNMAGGKVGPAPFNISTWMKGLQAGTVDSMTVGDKTYDGQIGGLSEGTEYVLGTTREVPIFEFRNLGSSSGSEFEKLVSEAESTVIKYHNKYKTSPRKIKRSDQRRSPHAKFIARQAASACFSSTSPTNSSASGSETRSGTTTPSPTPSCSLHKADPDQGINKPYCVCDSSITVPVQSISVRSPEQSCSFSNPPGATAQITPTAALGPATTNTNLCNVCTPVVNNEDSCSTIPGCVVQTAGVTVQAGSSPVHVGTMTGTQLYTSVSKALETLCPSVTQTTNMTFCSLGSQKIENIPYSDEGMLSKDGELVITVESSGYNETSLRDAMIKSAALTVQNSAVEGNCYNQSYEVEQLSRRGGTGFFSWLPSLYKRESPHLERETAVWCNTVGFAGVGYYGPYWHVDDVKNPTAWIYPHWEFQVAPGGDFGCDLLMGLIDAFAVIQPEFAIGDIELGEAVDVICKDKME